MNDIKSIAHSKIYGNHHSLTNHAPDRWTKGTYTSKKREIPVEISRFQYACLIFLLSGSCICIIQIDSPGCNMSVHCP